MAQGQIPDGVLSVAEHDLRKSLSAFLDRVVRDDQELVVLRDGEPIAAVVCMDALHALRHVAREVVEQLAERLSGVASD